VRSLTINIKFDVWLSDKHNYVDQLREHKGNGKIQTTKAQKGTRLYLYTFFNLGPIWGGWSTPRPWERDPVSIVQEAGWAPGPVWTGAENLAPPGFDPQAVKPVASRYTHWAKYISGLYSIQLHVSALHIWYYQVGFNESVYCSRGLRLHTVDVKFL
jgi:hypothetical protein